MRKSYYSKYIYTKQWNTSKNDKPFIVIALYESHGSTFPAYCHVNACIQP